MGTLMATGSRRRVFPRGVGVAFGVLAAAVAALAPPAAGVEDFEASVRGERIGVAAGPAGGVGAATASGERRWIVTADSAAALSGVEAEADARGTVLQTWDAAGAGVVAMLTDASAAELRVRSDVQAVELDSVVTASVDQSSPPWGLDRIDQRDLPSNGVYGYGNTGAGVYVYIIDTGLWHSHTEFAGRALYGAWIEFGDGTESWDCNGHGTHVSGTAAGSTYGVAKGATVVPVKVLNCSGSGLASYAVLALDWIVDNHPASSPAVINMSLGGSANAAVDNAVQAAINDGITVVVAAGNDGANTCLYSPARVPSAITVAASEFDDDDADYSNFGVCNDIFAPGSSIKSAWPGVSDVSSNTLSGTSMAAPHVAGAAARILQKAPTSSPAQVWATLDATATIGHLTECCNDPDKLLFLQPPPTAPGGVNATAGEQQATVSWTAPSDRGSPITGYQSTATPGGQTCSTAGTACVVTGLTAGQSYTFQVTATNGGGTSAPGGPSGAVVPTSLPPPPPPPPLPNTFVGSSKLKPGKSLRLGEYILAEDARSLFGMAPDGNLVLVVDGVVTWQAGTTGLGNHATMGKDGVLMVNNAGGQLVWNTGTLKKGASLLVERGRALVKRGAKTYWSQGAQHNALKSKGSSTFSVGSKMKAGSFLRSKNKRCVVALTGGELVMWRSGGSVIWRSATAGSGAVEAKLDKSGSLQLVNAAKAVVWSSASAGAKAKVGISDSCKLSVFTKTAVLWQQG